MSEAQGYQSPEFTEGTHNPSTPPRGASYGEGARTPTAILRSLGERLGLVREKPTHEQVDRLRTMHRLISLTPVANLSQDERLLLGIMQLDKWAEKLDTSGPDERLGLVDALYKTIAADQTVSFCADFPRLHRRLARAFRNQNMRDPEWILPPAEILAKRIGEYIAKRAPRPPGAVSGGGG